MLKRLISVLVAGAMALATLLTGPASGLADQGLISGTPTWQNVPVETQPGYKQQIDGQNYWFQQGTDSSTGQTVVKSIQLDLGHTYGYWWTATNGDQIFVEIDPNTGSPTDAVDYTQSNTAAQGFQEQYTKTVTTTIPTTIQVQPPVITESWIPQLDTSSWATLSGYLEPDNVDTQGWSYPYWYAIQAWNPNQYDINYSVAEDYHNFNVVVPGMGDSNASSYYGSNGNFFYLYDTFPGSWWGPPSGGDFPAAGFLGTSLIYNGQSYPIYTNPGYTITNGFGIDEFSYAGDFNFQSYSQQYNLLSGFNRYGDMWAAEPVMVKTPYFQPWPGQQYVGEVLYANSPGYQYQPVDEQMPTVQPEAINVNGTPYVATTITNNSQDMTVTTQPFTYTVKGWVGISTDAPRFWPSSSPMTVTLSVPAETIAPGQTVEIPSTVPIIDYQVNPRAIPEYNQAVDPAFLSRGTGQYADSPEANSPFFTSIWDAGGFAPLAENPWPWQDYVSTIVTSLTEYNSLPEYGWQDGDYLGSFTYDSPNTETANIPAGQYVVNINGTNITVMVPIDPYPATLAYNSPDYQNGVATHEAILQSIANQLNAASAQDGVTATYYSQYGGYWYPTFQSIRLQGTGSTYQFNTSDVSGTLLEMLGLTPVLRQGALSDNQWGGINENVAGPGYAFVNTTYYAEYYFGGDYTYENSQGYIDNAATLTPPNNGYYYSWVDSYDTFTSSGRSHGGYGDTFVPSWDPPFIAALGTPQIDASQYGSYIYNHQTSSTPVFGTQGAIKAAILFHD